MKAFLASRTPRSDGKRISEKKRTAHAEYSLRVQDDGRKHIDPPERKFSPCVQTKDISHHRSVSESTNQRPVMSVGRAADVQNASAVNETGVDKYGEPGALPDNEMRFLREQAAGQESFVDLLIGLVPFDALISHEDTCSTSCSKTALAENTSRGLLRWKQQCLRYDPAVLRATNFCVEQHVRDQEKEWKPCQVAGHKGKKPGKDVSRTAKQRKQQQYGKPFQKKRTSNDTNLGHRLGEGQRRRGEGKPGHLHTRDKAGFLDSKQERVSRKGVRLQEMEGTVGGVSGVGSDSREESREASVEHVNIHARPTGNSRTIHALSRVRGEQMERPRHKHRNTASGSRFRSSQGSCKSTNNLTQQHSSFKRQKKSQSHRVKPG